MASNTDKMDMALDDISQQQRPRRSTGGQHQGGYGKSRRPSSGQYQQQRRSAPYSNSNRGGQRHQSYRGGQQQRNYNQAAATTTTVKANIAPASLGNSVLKVSASSDCKKVAGAIAGISRHGDSPSLLAAGPASINQAIKAIAIARGYLNDDQIDFIVRPEPMNRSSSTAATATTADDETAADNKPQRNSFNFVLTKQPARRPTASSAADDQQTELRVSHESRPTLVAGSIAAKVRNGERVTILVIGAQPVSRTVSSISLARRYLERDNVDLGFRVEFVHVNMPTGDNRSAVKFTILAQQI